MPQRVWAGQFLETSSQSEKYGMSGSFSTEWRQHVMVWTGFRSPNIDGYLNPNILKSVVIWLNITSADEGGKLTSPSYLKGESLASVWFGLAARVRLHGGIWAIKTKSKVAESHSTAWLVRASPLRNFPTFIRQQALGPPVPLRNSKILSHKHFFLPFQHIFIKVPKS